MRKLVKFVKPDTSSFKATWPEKHTNIGPAVLTFTVKYCVAYK